MVREKHDSNRWTRLVTFFFFFQFLSIFLLRQVGYSHLCYHDYAGALLAVLWKEETWIPLCFTIVQQPQRSA